MKEPSLEVVLECLADVGYCFKGENTNNVVSNFFEKRKDVSGELEQLLFFCRAEQASTFQNAVRQIKDDSVKQRIVSALVMMYPITKNVILEMLRKADINPAEYLEVFDFDSILLKSIKESFDKVVKSSAASNVNANRYAKDLENLEKEIASLNQQRDKMAVNIKDYKEKQKEKDALEREIREIENLEKTGGIDAELEALQMQKRGLEKQKKEKDDEKRRLKKEISKLNTSLQSSKDKDESEPFQNALKALEECVKTLSTGR